MLEEHFRVPAESLAVGSGEIEVDTRPFWGLENRWGSVEFQEKKDYALRVCFLSLRGADDPMGVWLHRKEGLY